MKLHLPTRLRAAVLACFAVVTSLTTTLASGAFTGGAFAVTVAALAAPQASALTASQEIYINTAGTYDANGYTYSNGVLTGADTRDLTFDYKYSAVNSAGALIYVGDATGSNVAFGLWVKEDGAITGAWKGDNNAAIGAWGDGGSVRATAFAERDADADGSITLTAWIYGTDVTNPARINRGTHLAVGHDISVDSDDNININADNTTSTTTGNWYGKSRLRSDNADHTKVTVNTDYISGIYVADPTNSLTTYSSNGRAVTLADGEHVNVTTSMLQLDGGASGTAAQTSAAGKPIFVGGAGRLFLQTWSQGAISLDNDIYLGSSTHSEVPTRGVIDFGNDESDAYTIALNGKVVVLEDTSVMSRSNTVNSSPGCSPINFTGKVTDKEYIDGTTSTGGKTLSITGRGYHFSGAVDVSKVSLRTISAYPQTNVTMSGTGSRIAELSIAEECTLSLTGGSLSITGASIGQGTLNVSAANALTVAQGGSLTMGGTMALSAAIVNNGDITFGSGARMDVSGYALGDTAPVGGTGGTVGLTADTLVELGAGFTPELNKEYVVFGDGQTVTGWTSLTVENFRKAGILTGRSVIEMTDKGFKYTTIDTSVYTDMTTSGTRDWNYTDAVWDTAQDSSDAPIAFAAGDSAVFNAAAAMTVQESGVKAQDVSVSGNGVAVDVLGGKLTVLGTATIGTGAALNAASEVEMGAVNINGGTLELTGGGTLGYARLNSANSTLVFGGKVGTPYTTGTVICDTSDYGNYFTKNVTIQRGVSVTMESFRNSWGMGTLRVDGELVLTDEMYLWCGSNNGRTTDDLIAGSGSITVPKLTIGNGGAHSFNVNNFTVSGATSIGITTNVLGGTVNLNGATTLSSTLNVQGGTVNLNGATTLSSNANVSGGTLNINESFTLGADINVSRGILNASGVMTGASKSIVLTGGKLNLSSNGSSVGRIEVSNNEYAEVDITGNNTNIAVYFNIDGGSVRVAGTGTTAKDFRIYEGGSVLIDTGAELRVTGLSELKAPVENKGTLSLAGKLKIDTLNGFRMIPGVGATWSDGENGYLTGTATYEIVKNSGTLTGSPTLEGAAATGATYADGILTAGAADANTYWVNTTVTAAALGEGKSYRMNGGTLVIDASTRDAAAAILQATTGNFGKVQVAGNVTLATGANTQSRAELEVAGTLTGTNSSTTLTVGGAKGSLTSIASFSKVTLDGGKLNYSSSPFTIKNLTVTEKGGVINYADFKDSGHPDYNTTKADAMRFAGKTSLTGALTLTANYKYAARFDCLTGAGDLNAPGTNNGKLYLMVDSLEGYKGKINLTKGTSTTEVDIATGSKAVAFKGISATNAMTLNLNVEGATTMTEGLSLTNGATANVGVTTPGATLSGAVNVSGAGNTLTSTAAGLNLSQLNVAANAALTLNGSVSALLMNQAGTVNAADMLLTDGAVLTYGAAANLITITEDMLAGGVIVGTGLTPTASGVNLGLSSAIAQDKIDITGYAGNELAVKGDTWYLKTAATRYYWEKNGDAFWHKDGDLPWSATEGGTPGAALPSDTDNVVLVFSGDEDDANDNSSASDRYTMQWSNQKTVAGIEVRNGYYEFDGYQNTPTITCNGDLSITDRGNLSLRDCTFKAGGLVMGQDATLIVSNATYTMTEEGGGDILVSGAGAAIELGEDVGLSADALDISTAGASLSLSGTGTAGTSNSVTVSSISLGAGSGLTLAAGTSNLTLTANGITHDAGSTISIGADQVLDLSATTYGDSAHNIFSSSNALVSLLNATSGAGTLKITVDEEGQFRMRSATKVSTNVVLVPEAGKNTASMTINCDAVNNTLLTIDSDGSLQMSGALTLQSTAKMLVDGGELTVSGGIRLGHGTAGNPGHLTMNEKTTGSITTTGISTTNTTESGANTFNMQGGTLTISSTAGITSTVVTTITGGTLVASHADGWGVSGASVGGAAVAADSTGAVTLTNATITGDITGNGKLVLTGTTIATATATVSGASAGALTVDAASAGGLTLSGATITGDITGNDKLVLAGTVNTTANATVSGVSAGGNTVDAVSAGTLTLSGATITGDITGNGKLVLAGTVNATADATVSGVSAGGNTIDALSAGTLTLSGATITGDITGNDKLVLAGTVNTTANATVSGVSAGGNTVDAVSAGTLTLSGATITGDITGNGKLVLAGTVSATADATVSGASVGGATVATDANKLTLENATVDAAFTNFTNNGTLELAGATLGATITNNGTLTLSGTQNVTLAGISTTKYADVYGSTTYGNNGYRSTQSEYTLVSGTGATNNVTSWQLNGADPEGTTKFDGNVLTHVVKDAGKVYYVNSGSVEYAAGKGIATAEKIQLVGGTLVLSKELDTETTTEGIEVTGTVTGTGTALKLNNVALAATNLSIESGKSVALSGNGTLEMGMSTALAAGISLGTETDAKWTGTVKVAGATLTDADLSALGVSGSIIELSDTTGTLKDGTYAADVKLTNGSDIKLGDGNSFGLLDASAGKLSIGGSGNKITTLTMADDATGGTLSIAGVDNIISTLTMANDATLELNLSALGVTDLDNWDEGPMLKVTTLLDTETSGGKLNIDVKVDDPVLATLLTGQSKVLATIAKCQATLGDLLVAGEAENKATGIGGMEYKYTLEKVEDTGEVNLVITAANVYDGWVATDSDNTWTADDAIGDGKWSGVIGAFYGKGSSAVIIEDDGVTASTVIVSAPDVEADDGSLSKMEYTFTGGMLDTDLLAVNQGSLVLANAGVNAGQYVVLSNTGKLTVNADKELTVGEEQTTGGGLVGSFVSVGDEAELINKGTTTIHGTLGVAGTAGVTNSGKLTVDAVSAEEATIDNTGSLIITGGGVIGTLSGKGSLTNGGVLSIMSDTTLRELTNTGTLSVAGDLTVTSDIATGGTINIKDDADLQDATLSSLTVGVNAKAAGLTVGTANITGTLGADSLTVGTSANVGSDATLGALTNKGKLEVGGKLTVTSDITTGGTVKVTGNADLAGADFGSLTVGVNAKAAGLTVGTANITGTLGADSLTVGTSANVGSDATLGALTNKGTLEVGGKLTVTSDITTGGMVKVTGDAELAGADFGSLTVGVNAKAAGLTVGTANITGTLGADSLTVGTSANVGSDATLGALTNKGTLEVGGKLTVTSDITTGGTVKVTGDAELAGADFDSLTVGGHTTAVALTVKNADLGSLNETSLTVTSDITTGDTVKVGADTTLAALSSTGTLAINGDLAVKAPVAAGGAVKADNVTVAGDAVFTTLTTGKLTADSLAVANATLTTLATDKLTVNGGTVKVTDDVSLSQLAGTGQLTVDDKLTLTAAATGTVGVQAAEIAVAEVGNTLGTVATDALTMLEGSTLSRTTALLTVDSIAALTAEPVDITVSDSAFDALELSSDGSYSVGDYLIIAGATKADVFNYVNAEQLDAIRYSGKTAGLVVTDGVLSLSIAQATDESGKVIGNTWDTTGGNTTTSNGYDIPVGEDGFYKSLDYVSNVVVSDEYTIDLTPDMVGDSMPGNASEPDAGLLVRNLAGGGTLTIKGDGAEQDVVSIFGTAHSAGGDAVKVVVDAAALNLGLPVGNDGVMAEDAAATGATLARLSLKNLARAEVNADSVVTGATDLEDYTRLMVADGMTLETGQLLGGDNADVGGRIIVRKSGYYTGQYDEAYIGTGDGADLTLRVGGRRGLSLTAGGGSVKLLSAGQDGRMESLRVGPNPMARQAGGSTNLVLDNTTLRSDGSVEHHMTTIAAEEGNFINKSIVSLSLGAAETARTLNTAGNPVVLDGVVDVTDSAVKVNMIGAAVTEGVLDVTTDADENLTLARLTMAGGAVSGNTVTLTGTAEMMALVNKYYTNARLDANGAIKVDRVTDYYGRAMGELSENGMAGVQLADAALVKLNPQSDRDDYKELAEVLDTLDAVVKGGDTEAADQLGSALAGSSVAAMGAALAGDMERQLRAIRNRTTTMGVDQTAVNKDMPYFNAWINAEGDLRRLDQDTTYAGYDLSSWGGTVGFDVDVTPQLTFGLAVTSMWGDFTAKGCELAEGELQTNYVTAFARYGARRWVHTFVASVGMSETSLERTVNHANGSYTTEGDADGVSYGFLYEVGYVFAANEEATACIQPVVNVMLAHSSLSGYDESGSSAALSTGDVDMTTLTIGAGVRAQAVMGENLYNRASIVEARALFKVRGGDREATAENALLAVPGSAVSAKAAEMGTLSCELGIGVTVPIGADGSSVFADASVDVGGGYSDFNGTVGYLINF